MGGCLSSVRAWGGGLEFGALAGGKGMALGSFRPWHFAHPRTCHVSNRIKLST